MRRKIRNFFSGEPSFLLSAGGGGLIGALIGLIIVWGQISPQSRFIALLASAAVLYLVWRCAICKKPVIDLSP